MDRDNMMNFSDSCCAELTPLDDGTWSWDITWPAGNHTRGKAADKSQAQAAVNAQRDRWIIQQWQKGVIARKTTGFLVPLN